MTAQNISEQVGSRTGPVFVIKILWIVVVVGLRLEVASSACWPLSSCSAVMVGRPSDRLPMIEMD